MNAADLRRFANEQPETQCRMSAQRIAEKLHDKKRGTEIFNRAFKEPREAYVDAHLAFFDQPKERPEGRATAPEASARTLDQVRAEMEAETDPERKYELADEARQLRGHGDLFVS